MFRGSCGIEKFKIKDYQLEAVNKLQNGNILKGGTGTGKSFTALYYYYVKVCGGEFDPDLKPMKNPRPLYIITTPKKRDEHEWDVDLNPFLLSSDAEVNTGPPIIVDSWNNIKKYVNVYGAFFIFDEQRAVGSGAWVKAFLKITNKNKWILCTATPGDTWSDYIPVFIANGFYKNKTEFKRKHIEYNPYTRYPSIKAYHGTGILIKHRNQITVTMKAPQTTIQIHKNIICSYDEEKEKICLRKRWNPFEDRPLRDATEMAVVMRRIAFGDKSRLDEVWNLHSSKHPKIIIFYDYNFELDALIEMCEDSGFKYAQWNGHKHESVPTSKRWLYLVQYTAGNDGWNCTTCSTMIFFNDNYSYKKMTQAAGRIDRLNTPFKELYYYHLTSNSFIDKRIKASQKQKKDFNEMKTFRRYFDDTRIIQTSSS